MNANPYRSPTSLLTPPLDPHLRHQALGAFRVSLLILLLPAALNYAAFDFAVLSLSGLPGHVIFLYRLANIIALVAGLVALWYLGFPLLEVIAHSIRHVAARHADTDQWMLPFYLTVCSLIGSAAAAALLWAAWIVAIYFAGANFYLASWAAGLPAVMLGVLLCLPMVIRWRDLATARPAGPA